jgi:pyruvate dehydrogenase E2 component (dihydrolipoamide acetyltransferase)/2-oxoisovalerate dehydrogenase E2 component (dihydrolipoyl transacylase)
VEPGQKVSISDPILQYQEKQGASTKEDKPAAAKEPSASGKEEAPAADPAEDKPKPETKAKAPPAAAPAANPEGKPKTPATAPAPAPARDNGVAFKAAPSVRQMARKLGIDLKQIRGSGPAGRILIDDLVPLVSQAAKAPKVAAAPLLADGKRIPFTGLRRKIAEHMVASKQTIPHYSHIDECDVTELVKLREANKESFAKQGTKLTYLAFFVKAAVAALKEVPGVNASLDAEKSEIVLYDHYHIGIAVATPGGLIVPVIHDADKKSLLELAREIERLSNDARQGKQRLEDLRGGTFTVTSIGNIGGLFSTPIILPPQLGIVGVGKIVKRPVFDEHGKVKAADMVYLSFSFDHRVLDGAVGAAFGNAMIKCLQDPAAMLGPI